MHDKSGWADFCRLGRVGDKSVLRGLLIPLGLVRWVKGGDNGSLYDTAGVAGNMLTIAAPVNSGGNVPAIRRHRWAGLHTRRLG